jgi:hypothetical protein
MISLSSAASFKEFSVLLWVFEVDNGDPRIRTYWKGTLLSAGTENLQSERRAVKRRYF